MENRTSVHLLPPLPPLPEGAGLRAVQAVERANRAWRELVAPVYVAPPAVAPWPHTSASKAPR